MNPRVLSFLLVCPIMGVAAAGEMRTWMAPDGRVIRGEFLKGDDKSITVQKSDLTSVTIPVDKLIKADQETARKLVTEAAANADKKGESQNKAKEKGPGSLTYKLSDGSENWPEDRKKRIVAAMDEAVEFLNKNARFKKALIANNSPGTPTADASYSGWINWGGAIVALAVFGGLLWTILKTISLAIPAPQIEPLTVKRIGEVLMTHFVWPLQCVGLVLTAALIGALVLVMEEKR